MIALGKTTTAAERIPRQILSAYLVHNIPAPKKRQILELKKLYWIYSWLINEILIELIGKENF